MDICNGWCWIKLEHNFSNCSTAQIRNNMETSDKQKPPSCSPPETFEWHRHTGEKVLKRVDKHDSAEMLERGWLDKCPPADRGFSFERTSSGVIEAHSWQVLRPLVTKALTNGNSPTRSQLIFSGHPPMAFLGGYSRDGGASKLAPLTRGF